MKLLSVKHLSDVLHADLKCATGGLPTSASAGYVCAQDDDTATTNNRENEYLSCIRTGGQATSGTLIKNIVMICCGLFAISSSPIIGAEPRPTNADEIRAAMTRAHELRKKSVGFNPLVAQGYGLLLKSGDERCGHATVVLEKSTQAGAVYTMNESYKAALDDGTQGIIVDYKGSFQLDGGLSLISGELVYQFNNMKNDGSSQQTIHTAKFAVKNDKIEWTATEQALLGKDEKGEKTPQTLATQPVDLHGVLPIPRNALLAFAALIGSAQANFKPNAKEGWCLPVVDVDWEQNTVNLSPAWVSLDEPVPAFSKNAPPKGTALQLRVRSLSGEVTEKGLEVDTPDPESWHHPQVWALDEKFRPLAHPVPDDVRIQVEAVDLATLKTDVPLNLSNIAVAMKAALEKSEQDNKQK